MPGWLANQIVFDILVPPCRNIINSPYISSLMKHRLATFVLTACCLMISPARATDSTTTRRSLSAIVADDARVFLEDGAYFFTSPLRFNTRDWLYVGAAAGGSLAIMSVDGELKKRIGRETEKTLNNDFWDIPTRYGVVQYANIFAVGTYASGLFIGNEDIRVTGRLLFESLSFSGSLVMVMRYVAGRSRPYDDNSPWDFNGFQWSNRFQAFPSGHTTVAFALSAVLAERIDNIWARIGFYGLASLTAFARVYNNQHWMSDVVVGAGAGLAAGLVVVSRERERESGNAGGIGKFGLYPYAGGVRLVFRLD